MRRSSLLGVVLAVVVAVQVLIPAAMLLSPRMSAFGWQMYAERVSVMSAEPLDPAGKVVNVPRWAARLRPEVRWEQVAPNHLCGRPDVASVRVAFSDGSQDAVRCPAP